MFEHVIVVLCWLSLTSVCVMHALEGLQCFPPQLHWIPIAAMQAMGTLVTFTCVAIARTLKTLRSKEDK